MSKYIQDNSYFEKIDTERKAYWLGFLYADGCVFEKGEKNKKIIIQLHPDDKNVLEEFLKDINSNRPICVDKKGYIFIGISSTKMANDLINLGCIPRKSLVLKFPNEDMIPKNLINHFVRGYMDGDGCISTYMKLRKKRKSPILICEIKFIGTYDMLYGIKLFFDSEKKILINRHSPNSCQISFAGKKYRDIVDSLYENATFYMKRKKDKWDEFKRYMEYQKNKREEKSCIEVVKLDKDANYIGTYTLQELKKEFDVSDIKKCCKYEKYKSHKNFLWLYLKQYNEFLKDGINIRTKLGYKEKNIDKKAKQNKTIEQYDLKGNYIDTWDTVKLAAEYYNTTPKAIRRVCTGERKSCCNFIWQYADRIENKKKRAVRQYDINGNLIKEWPNLREAATFYEVTFQAIERAISGKYKTCCGFMWKYSE
ncbi:hypothetical protein SAMN02745163_02673 [Clostridium cavendishii DSM 21758]|uniref:Nuclease-associated modular DNA-binding 1 domain-containing protein n=1 Tax=Clostridium cavendishii DSM 21758 TaxID=1121302 RepID=A0A1M6MKR4_9CLOT|nr:NUMOD1 domain-containing DNA-binding protein [Clostridium cavendishii]SHJ83986.1 hypothetical protein SAMN02745163_02673 [Clostridium cavendishii DSM 21758]